MRHIFGTYGTLAIAPDGTVTNWDAAGAEYWDIIRFDVDELRRWAAHNAVPLLDTIDIIMIGYWCDGGYVAANSTHRELSARARTVVPQHGKAARQGIPRGLWRVMGADDAMGITNRTVR